MAWAQDGTTYVGDAPVVVSKRRWTEEEDKYLRENALTMNRVEIAKTLDRSPSAVSCRAFTLGIVMDKHSKQRELIVQGKKQCSRCGETQFLEDFHKNKAGLGGVGNNCRSCQRQYLRERRLADPDRATNVDLYSMRKRELASPGHKKRVSRKSLLKQNYGLTLDDYDKLLESQGGVCAICGTDTPGGKGEEGTFAVDHDHSCCPGRKTCGKCVRGLLCGNCNTGLGKFKDDPHKLQSAISYLSACK